MPARVRPTSPHLQVYRWEIGNSLSILHRMTGVALALGLVAMAYWLVSVAGGEHSYRSAAKLFAGPIGLLVLVGWTFAFMFHLLNGVRHLFWDIGRGFERTERHASGWFAFLGAIVATLAVWVFILHFRSV